MLGYKVPLIIISVFLLALASFYFILQNRKHCRNQTSTDVCLTIINKSGQGIKKLTLLNGHGSIECNSLMQDQDTTLQYKAGGEGMYSWNILFENDSLMRYGNYIEGGYCVVDTVTANGIHTHYCDFLWKR